MSDRKPLRRALDRIGWGNGPADVDRHGISLTASAAIVDLTDRSEAARLARKATRQAWHEQAWACRNNIGELRYLQDWLGNNIARMRLYAGVLVDGADEPLPIDDAVTPPPHADRDPIPLPAALVAAAKDALAALGDPSPILNRGAVNMEVTGEWYLVGYRDQLGRERWEARSSSEIDVTDAGTLLRDFPGQRYASRPALTKDGGPLLDPADSYCVRVWRADAQWSGLSASPMVGVLDRCEELLLLGKKIRAAARSRANAGLLFVPAEGEFAASVDPVTGETIPARPLSDVLMETLVSPVADESAPSALVPAIVKFPGEQIANVRLVDLGRNTDPADRGEREEALLRVLRGVDVPPEVVTGFADVKYANAKAIDKASFRDNVEPKVLTLIHALTTAYLRPRLLDLGFAPDLVDQLCIWYDPAAVTTDPDQGTDAQAVYDAGELSGASLRKFRGFDESDAPTPDDRAFYLATRGKGTPAGNAVSNPVDDVGKPADATASAVLTVARPMRDLSSGLRRRALAVRSAEPQPIPLGEQLLRIDLGLFGRLSAAADAAMRRTIERAGARARSKARTAGDSAGAGIPNDRLVASLGAEGIGALGLTSAALLGDDPFGELGARFEEWSAQAFEAGLRATARALSLTYYPPGVTAAAPPPFSDGTYIGGIDYVTLREAAEADRGEASRQLRARLTEIASRRLYEPDQAATEGEADPSLTVPPGVVRAAMARAGGADSAPGSSGVDQDGRPASPDDPLPGGVATGMSIREASARAGLSTYAYSWSHGESPSPFEPHLRLDGQVFADQSDRRLTKDPAAWPRGTTSYYPGDHPGCSCWTQFLYADPFAGLSPADARTVRAAQKARDVRGRYAGRRDHPDDTPGGTTTPRPRQ